MIRKALQKKFEKLFISLRISSVEKMFYISKAEKQEVK